MLKERKDFKKVVLLLALFFSLQSCSNDMVDTMPISPLPESQIPAKTSLASGRAAVDEATSSSLSTGAVAVSKSSYKPMAMERQSVSYLRDVIPPCLPVDGSEQNPCPQGTPAVLEQAGIEAGFPHWTLDGISSFDDILLGRVGEVDRKKSILAITPHLVVRGVVKADTTRCDLYPFKEFSYQNFLIRNYQFYYCFAEFSVREYIVGVGPNELTIALHREVLFLNDQQVRDWPKMKDTWVFNELENPQLRTAQLFEGKELILLLRTSSTVTLESWAISEFFGNVWFLQQDEHGEIRAIEKEIAYAAPEERSYFDLPVSELVKRIKEAAENRVAATGGRIGDDPTLPMLVTDANNLQDYYKTVGATYEGDEATVLPPPIPGAEDPEQEPTQTDENQPQPNPPVPGEETPSPPPTDDAATTTTQPTSEETTTTTGTTQPEPEDTIPTPTGTTQPPDDDTPPPTVTETTQPQTGDTIPTPTETTQPTNGGAAIPAGTDEQPTQPE